MVPAVEYLFICPLESWSPMFGIETCFFFYGCSC